MAWTLGGTPLFVTKLGNLATQAIARLQPLASGTLYHSFGYEFLIKKLTAYVVGTDDELALIDCTRTGNAYTLLGPTGWTWGDYYVKSASFDMQNSISQTLIIDADHDCLDPVFVCDLELFKQE
jgi:hypothetical protein